MTTESVELTFIGTKYDILAFRKTCVYCYTFDFDFQTNFAAIIFIFELFFYLISHDYLSKMETICKICDGSEFTVNAGFYYCDNCGQRAAALQEVEDQADGQFDDVHKKSHKIKKVEQTKSK